MKAKLHLGAAVVALFAVGGGAIAQDMAFGMQADTDRADALWQAMIEARLAGDDALHVKPYVGTEPHGAVLETFNTDFELDGQSGQLVVKRNHGGEGVTPSTVWDDPVSSLMSVTVMFEDTDAESGWFWAKYLPDGTLDQAPNGTAIAGQAAGCIGCHSGAAGDDMLFVNDE